MTLAEFKTRVKIKVDEYTPDGVSHSFDDYLEPMIQEAADELSDKAPIHLLDPSTISTAGIKYENDLAYIPVPTNFARLYAVKFPLWEKVVFKAISQDNPEHEKQNNPYLKAGYGRPVVVIQSHLFSGGSIQKYLVCGKVADGGTPTYARCVEYRTAATMPSVLEEAITWLAASKVLQILGESDQAKLAHDNHLIELRDKAK